MAKKIGLEVEVQTGQAEKSVGNIRKELKAANGELIAAQKNFGEYSKEAIAAARRVAELKDSISEARETADLFDPGKKFQVFAGALNAVAGGFAAVQGAQALFGSESEELAKTLQKVQGALALTQGLNTITDSAKDFQRLGAVIKTQVVTAFSTLKGAIAATGIGLLVIGITTLIAKFDDLKRSGGLLGAVVNGLADAYDFVTRKIQDFTDWIGITASEEEAAAARIKKSAEQQKAAKEAAYDAELAIARATGKGVAEIEERKRKEVLKTLETQSLQLRLLKSVFGDNAPAWIGDALANIEIELTKVRTEQKVAEIEAEKKKQADAKALADKRAQDAKQAADEAKRKADEAQRERERVIAQQAELANELRREKLVSFQKELDDVNEQYKKRVELAKGNKDLLLQIEQSRDAQITDIRDKYNLDEDDRVKTEKKNVGEVIGLQGLRLQAEVAADRVREDLAEKEKERKKKEEEAYRNLAAEVIDIVGKQSAAGKAIAIALATIDTYQAANSALRANYGIFGPFAQVARFTAVAATIARGIANVKQIAAVRVPGVSGGGGSAPGAPPVPATPSAPIAPRPETTSIDQQSINAVGNAAAGRAFVLSTDIQNDRERIAMLNRRARIN